jgi:soluble lytic murein transglycosylase-like protein
VLLFSALLAMQAAASQRYEPLAASVRIGLAASVTDYESPKHGFSDSLEATNWLTAMSARLERRLPDYRTRIDFLKTLHYEATRAGLDPQLVLALIQVESNFRKYAVSSAGARGYMQVMPFWVSLIGRPGDNLFGLRANLRYGCVILKHYLDIEKGNLERALGRYNGSLGKPEYPRLVFGALRAGWRYVRPETASL